MTSVYSRTPINSATSAAMRRARCSSSSKTDSTPNHAPSPLPRRNSVVLGHQLHSPGDVASTLQLHRRSHPDAQCRDGDYFEP